MSWNLGDLPQSHLETIKLVTRKENKGPGGGVIRVDSNELE